MKTWVEFDWGHLFFKNVKFTAEIFTPCSQKSIIITNLFYFAVPHDIKIFFPNVV